MEHDQFEVLIAAVLTAGQIACDPSAAAKPAETLARTLQDLRTAQIIVKRNANFVPKGGR
jgi:hypothetical protein